MCEWMQSIQRREYAFHIVIKNNPSQLEPEEWCKSLWVKRCNEIPDLVEREKRCPEGVPFNILAKEEVIIGNVNSYVIKSWQGDYAVKTFYVSIEDKMFELNFSLYPDPNDFDINLFEDIYNQMISSFKFIE